jgi:predicted transposase YdaD
VQLIAGLKYDKETLRSIFREETMQESVIYQDIAQGGRLSEGKTLVLRLLSKRLGSVPQEFVAQVEALSLERLELLAEALLDFRSLTDLTNWLQS